MAIPLTWRNLAALTGLVVIILSAFATATSTLVQWQLDGLDKRLSDRLSIYQRDEENTQHELDRIEHRLNKLEHP